MRATGYLAMGAGISLALALGGWDLEMWRISHFILGGVPLLVGTILVDRGERLQMAGQQQRELTPSQARVKSWTNAAFAMASTVIFVFVFARFGLDVSDWPMGLKGTVLLSFVAVGVLTRPVKRLVAWALDAQEEPARVD